MLHFFKTDFDFFFENTNLNNLLIEEMIEFSLPELKFNICVKTTKIPNTSRLSKIYVHNSMIFCFKPSMNTWQVGVWVKIILVE